MKKLSECVNELMNKLKKSRSNPDFFFFLKILFGI